MFKNKVLMITGGTGSFGNAVLQRMLNSGLAEIRIFSRDEKKQDDMRTKLKNDRVSFYIGDVRDFNSVNDAMHGVDYVFHAAALKQVPTCEFYPMEAVQTNVLGAENVMRAAVSNGVKRCIVLSTDKAVYPINAMGMSKALMEKAMIAKSRASSASGTIFCATRYGNVMASRGSVIPLFLDQILSDQHLTVTDPSMTRFLMTLDESVSLVLHAFEHAQSGDIFVQKSPASTIGDLAVAMKEVFSSDAPIKIIGSRHGEKLYETLLSREERSKAIEHQKYYRVPADSRSLNYESYITQGEPAILAHEDYTSHNTNLLDVAAIKQMLLAIDAIASAVQTKNRAHP